MNAISIPLTTFPLRKHVIRVFQSLSLEFEAVDASLSLTVIFLFQKVPYLLGGLILEYGVQN